MNAFFYCMLLFSSPLDGIADQTQSEIEAAIYPSGACDNDANCRKVRDLVVSVWTPSFSDRDVLGLLTPPEAQAEFLCSSNQLCRNWFGMPPTR